MNTTVSQCQYATPVGSVTFDYYCKNWDGQGAPQIGECPEGINQDNFTECPFIAKTALIKEKADGDTHTQTNNE